MLFIPSCLFDTPKCPGACVFIKISCYLPVSRDWPALYSPHLTAEAGRTEDSPLMSGVGAELESRREPTGHARGDRRFENW